jgi:hypothetical protein
MELGLDSTLVAARIDLAPGLDSEEVEEVAVRIKRSVAHTFPEADQIFLDVTDAGAARAAARRGEGGTSERVPTQDAPTGDHTTRDAAPTRDPATTRSPAATGERGGA